MSGWNEKSLTAFASINSLYLYQENVAPELKTSRKRTGTKLVLLGTKTSKKEIKKQTTEKNPKALLSNIFHDFAKKWCYWKWRKRNWASKPAVRARKKNKIEAQIKSEPKTLISTVHKKDMTAAAPSIDKICHHVM